MCRRSWLGVVHTPENMRWSLTQTPGWAWTEAQPHGQCPFPAYPVLDMGLAVDLGRRWMSEGPWGRPLLLAKPGHCPSSLLTCGLSWLAVFPEGARPVIW